MMLFSTNVMKFEYVGVERGMPVVLKLLFFFLTSLTVLYFASPGTSPSNPFVGGDTSVFMVMGETFADGCLPYKSFFDHKGPLLYYIFSLARYDLFGKFVIYLLQSVAMTITLFSSWSLFRIYLDRRISFVVMLFLTFYFISRISAGGLTGEWSLPISMLLLYLVVSHIRNATVTSIRWYLWVFMGVGIGWNVMLRVTNAGSVCGIITAVFILLFYRGKWIDVLKSILYIKIGFVFIVAPIIAHFYFHDALEDLWYGLYQFNHHYVGNGLIVRSIPIVLYNVLPAAIAIFSGIYLCRKNILQNEVWGVMISMLIITFVSLMPGYAFEHYFMNFFPVMFCAMLVIGMWISQWAFRGKYVVGMLLLILLNIASLSAGIKTIVHGGICIFFPEKPTEEFNKLCTAKRFAEKIKKSDIQTVLSLDGSCEVYLYLGIMPACKYFVLQSFHSQVDPMIKQEVEEILRGDNAPAWIIVTTRNPDAVCEGNIGGLFEEIVKERYTSVDSGTVRAGRNDRTYVLFSKNSRSE